MTPNEVATANHAFKLADCRMSGLMRIRLRLLLTKILRKKKPKNTWPTYPSGYGPNEGKCGWHFTQGYKEHINKSVNK